MREYTDLKLNNKHEIFSMVSEENINQLLEWGIQTHSPFEWLGYALEELGETSKAISEYEYRDGARQDVVKEAIQAATLMLKIAEFYDKDPEFKRVYLAGPMLDCSDEESSDWREEAKSKIEGVCIDPCDRFFEVEPDAENDVVKPDMEDIRSVDIVLANCWKYSPGTSMEVFYAANIRKVVISIIPKGIVISHWIKTFSTVIVSTLEEGIERVNKYINNGKSVNVT